jgi:hypothetical protein
MMAVNRPLCCGGTKVVLVAVRIVVSVPFVERREKNIPGARDAETSQAPIVFAAAADVVVEPESVVPLSLSSWLMFNFKLKLTVPLEKEIVSLRTK